MGYFVPWCDGVWEEFPCRVVVVALQGGFFSVLCKMIFIYNALQNGWTVKMLKNNQFEFIKSKKKTKTNLNLNKFIKKNLVMV